MATVDEILTRQAYAAGDETWTKDNNYPSYTMYAEPEYVPVTNKRIADFNDQVSVRGEQNAQFVGFQLPRYDDAMDLSTQNLYIHYQTVYGGSDGVPCNVSWSDNYVRLCWMIPGQATQEPGSIQMMIYATGTDSTGDRTIWKTLPATYTIHDGLEIGGGIPEPDPSWYEQFVAQMEGKVSTAQGYANDAQASKVAAAGSATAAAQSADASAQALQENKDYVESQKETFVGYNKRETDLKYANALIGSASGTGRVSVGDAWEAPIPDLEVAGKSDQFTTTGAQLFDANTIPPIVNSELSIVNNNDGSITAKGTQSYSTTTNLSKVNLTPGKYYITGSIGDIKSIARVQYNNQTEYYSNSSFDVMEGSNVDIFIKVEAGKTVDGTIYPMLNAGDTALPWEPYTGGKPAPSPDYPQPIISTGTITKGVQLLDFRNGKSGTVGGITYTNIGDGTYKRTGTVTSSSGAVWFLGGYNITPNADDSNVIITLKKGVEYIAKDCWLFWFLDNAAFSCEEGKTFTPESDIKITGVRNPWQIEGSTYNDVIRPMLVEGDTVIWEPYTGGKPSPSEAYPQPLDIIIQNKNMTGTLLPGAVDMDGTEISRGNAIRSGYIKIDPGKTYTFSRKKTFSASLDTCMARIFNSDKVFLGSMTIFNRTDLVKTISDGFQYAGASYIRLVQFKSTDDTFDGLDLQMEEGDTVTDYEPPMVQTATITLTEPLRGIGDYRDRIMCRDGVWGIERQFIALTFDGSENWEYHGTAASDQFRLALSNYMGVIKNEENADKPIKIICDRLKAGSSSNTYGRIECISSNTSGRIYIYLDDFSSGDVAAFKTYLSTHPINAIFERATPTWEPLPSATQTALNALTTFTGTTHITITAGGPEPDVAVEYVQDTKAVIADLQAQINAIRNGGTT